MHRYKCGSQMSAHLYSAAAVLKTARRHVYVPADALTKETLHLRTRSRATAPIVSPSVAGSGKSADN